MCNCYRTLQNKGIFCSGSTMSFFNHPRWPSLLWTVGIVYGKRLNFNRMSQLKTIYLEKKFQPSPRGCGSAFIFCRTGSSSFSECGSGSSLTKLLKNKLIKFSIVVKKIKDCSKVRNNGALCNFTLKNWINLQLLSIS